jgi:sterol desaturase/sphingolipid hydroxylase (fatty acid hydroxylase superfamily)
VIYSASNYWLLFVGDALAAIVFLVLGLRLSDGALPAVATAVVVGFVAWGGVEYGFHRWILHGRPSMASRAHARHHADGQALIAAPAFTSAALAVVTWAALSIPLTTGYAALIVFGVYAGYNYYALLHHLQHHHRTLLAWVPSLARLEQAHRTHHARYVVNYGVSTTWWDRAFGSYQRGPRDIQPAMPLKKGPDVAPS